MYNQNLLDKMIDKFGIEKTISFAEMVSEMHGILYEESVSNGHDEPTEHNFERDWWRVKFEELKHNINERLAGKVSVCNHRSERVGS